MSIVLMWVLLMWVGWTFVFATDPNSLLDTRDDTPADWTGKHFRTLDRTLNTLSTQLGALAEQSLAYPILQYYHAVRREKSPVIALAVLDEALTLLRYGVPERAWPNLVELRLARATVASFLETLESAFIPPADEPPVPPDLMALQNAGIPIVEEESFQEAVAKERDRRRKLLGLVRNDGWLWSDGRS